MATVNYPTVIYGDTTTTSYQVRSIKSEFGDGYQEVTPDGINYIVQEGTLVHPLLPIANYTENSVSYSGATTLRNFLKQYCGTSTIVVIKNMMEDPTGATTKKVFLDNWSERYDGVLYTFNVRYREAFNE